jgi:hypothetical protein
MNEIIGPHLKKAFNIDEMGFADIFKKVRYHQFQGEIQLVNANELLIEIFEQGYKVNIGVVWGMKEEVETV